MKMDTSVIDELKEYLEQYADAEYFTDSAGAVPNEEMRLLAYLVEFEESLKKILKS